MGRKKWKKNEEDWLKMILFEEDKMKKTLQFQTGNFIALQNRP